MATYSKLPSGRWRVQIRRGDIFANKVRDIHLLNMAGDIEAAKDLYVSSVMNAMFIIDAKERYADVVAYADKINGRKSAEIRQKDARYNYSEWQEIADKKWKRDPGLSRHEIAEYIVEGQKTDYGYDETVKVYSVDYVRRKIRKR